MKPKPKRAVQPKWLVFASSDDDVPTCWVCNGETQRNTVTLQQIYGDEPSKEEADADIGQLEENGEIFFEDGWIRWEQAYLEHDHTH